MVLTITKVTSQIQEGSCNPDYSNNCTPDSGWAYPDCNPG